MTVPQHSPYDDIVSVVGDLDRYATDERLRDLPDVAWRDVVRRVVDVVPLHLHAMCVELARAAVERSGREVPIHRHAHRPRSPRELVRSLVLLRQALTPEEAAIVDEALRIGLEHGVLPDVTRPIPGDLALHDLVQMASLPHTVDSVRSGAASLFLQAVSSLHSEAPAVGFGMVAYGAVPTDVSVVRSWDANEVPGAMLRLEPMSPILRSDDPFKDLEALFALEVPSRAIEEEQRVEIALGAVRVAERIFGRTPVRDLGVRFRFTSDPVDGAMYVPDDHLVVVHAGPLSSFFVLHELAHAVDAQLLERPPFGPSRACYASEDPSTPIHAFCASVRHLHRPICAEIARNRVVRTLLPGLPVPLAARMVEGPVPAVDGLEACGFSPAESAAIAFDLSLPSTYGPDGEIDVDRLIRSYGVEPDPRWGALEMLSPFVRIDGNAVSLDPSVPYRVEYAALMEAPEIFARSVDQYARRYLASAGLSFGPVTWPGDLPEADAERVAPLLVRALHEVRSLAEDHDRTRATQVGLVDLGVSGVVAIATLASALGILS
jgi:hypothetical protein